MGLVYGKESEEGVGLYLHRGFLYVASFNSALKRRCTTDITVRPQGMTAEAIVLLRTPVKPHYRCKQANPAARRAAASAAGSGRGLGGRGGGVFAPPSPNPAPFDFSSRDRVKACTRAHRALKPTASAPSHPRPTTPITHPHTLPPRSPTHPPSFNALCTLREDSARRSRHVKPADGSAGSSGRGALRSWTPGEERQSRRSNSRGRAEGAKRPCTRCSGQFCACCLTWRARPSRRTRGKVRGAKSFDRFGSWRRRAARVQGEGSALRALGKGSRARAPLSRSLNEWTGSAPQPARDDFPRGTGRSTGSPDRFNSTGLPFCLSESLSRAEGHAL
ncbi:hypothetical protein AOLI_G00251540 [Acnodon oligacanthus]